MAEFPLFLGIDGGGTRCRSRIADLNGQILGEGHSGSANTRLGVQRSFDEMIAATRNALADAGLTNTKLDQLHAYAGLAGLSLQTDRRKVGEHDHPFASFEAHSDAYIACVGAHNGADGAIVILGTGSCGLGIVKGQIINAGGWGLHLSDQGSGAQLGLEAVRRSILAQENIIPHSALSRRIMASFDNSVERAVLWANDAIPAEFGRLASLVCDQDKKDDTLAVALMRWAAADATLLINAMRHGKAPRISLLGGFAPHLTPWLSEKTRSLLLPPQGDAMDGALRLARQRWEQNNP